MTRETLSSNCIRRQRRRQAFLDQGLCPVCRGKEPLLPGCAYGEKCQRKSQGRAHRALPDPGPSVWDLVADPLGSLDAAIAQADLHLAGGPAA